MSDAREVLDAENRFFGALLGFNRAALDAVLAPDFLLIDVMTGSEIPRSFSWMPSRPDSSSSRPSNAPTAGSGGTGDTAIVTGETRMRGRYSEQSFAAHSRYTHVYLKGASGWQLVTAQGTPIAPASA